MRLKYLAILAFVLTSLNLSCNFQRSSQELTDIYNLVIDSAIMPFPPPPPESDNNLSMPKKVRDSLKAIKLDIAISNQLELYDKQSFNIFGYENYQSAKKNLIDNKNQTLIRKHWLKTKKGHNISVIDIKDVNKSELFEKYNAVTSLSNIGFNLNKDKAITIVGISYAPKLSGTVILYFLEKINDEWKIKHKKAISIS